MQRKIFMGLFGLFNIGLQLNIYGFTIKNSILGVGPQSSLINPHICIQDKNGTVTYDLNFGESVDGNVYSKDPNYIGATIRFNGCDFSDIYLGYIGISAQEIKYTPPKNMHIIIKNPKLDAQGNLVGKIEYTPINSNFSLRTTAPKLNPNWDFIGANLSGLEFGKVIDPLSIPNLSEEDKATPQSDLNDTQAFLKAGMNTFRIPLHWGYLQPDGAGIGDINMNYYNSFVKPQLETLTATKVNVIVDLHAYMRYSEFGKHYAGCGPRSVCPDGTLITNSKAYVDVWIKLYNLIKNNPKIDSNYILFDLINEPTDVPDDFVFTIQRDVIKSLRQNGFQGYILVEGNSWSGLHSWVTNIWKSTDGTKSYSNASLFTREHFAQEGILDLTKIAINVHQYLDIDYSGTHDQCLTDLSTVGNSGFNLTSFANYLKENQLTAMVTEFGSGKDVVSCTTALTEFINYLKENKSDENHTSGFIGWTIWSTGHGWGDYNLRVTPTSYHINILKDVL